MSILTVNVNGNKFIIDCANKGTAKAWGRNKLEVEVTEATGAEITDFLTNGGEIEVVAPKAEAVAVAEVATETAAS